MDTIISLPDDCLRYISHTTTSDIITIHIESASSDSVCPYCGAVSNKVHSRYGRKLQDLPIQGKKVILALSNKKFFCRNNECVHKTFAEQFEFYEKSATTTKRLQEEVLRISLTQSSVSASKYLRNSVVNIGKSTICAMLKKGH